MKKMNKKGFTLAELLIVVAIIAVLVAIAIPVFTAQLDKAHLATATANTRSAYAEYVADCLADAKEPSVSGFQSSTVYSAIDLSTCTIKSVGNTEIEIESPKGNTSKIPVDLITVATTGT